MTVENQSATGQQRKGLYSTPEPTTGGKSLKVTLIKSPIRSRPEHKDTIRSLGLRKIRQSHTLPDNPAIRGMIKSVQQWVTFEEV